MKLTGDLYGEDGAPHHVTIEVEVNEGGGSSPTPTATRTVLAGTAPVGTTAHLTATVDPAVAGTVRFLRDGAEIGRVHVTADQSTAVLDTEVGDAGTASFVAVFEPSDATHYEGSASAEVVVTLPMGWTFPDGTNTLFVGAAETTIPVAAIDPPATRNGYPAGRGENETILITRASGDVTKTNEWGTEVQVGADGTMVNINDRVLTEDTTGTVVPRLGYVISAHGTAADRLRGLYEYGTTVTPGHIDPPKPTGKLPAWLTGAYWQQYEGPAVEQLPAAYNLIWAAFALGNGGQAMSFSPYVQDVASFKKQMWASQDKGTFWGISMGGGVEARYATLCRTKDEANRVFKNMKSIIDEYKFKGVDDDFENGPSGFTEVGLTELFRLFRAEYGPDFVLASTPRPYEDFRKKIAANLYEAGLLTLLQWQFYDSNEYKDATYLRNRVKTELEGAVQLGIPLSAQVIGAITRTTYKYGWNKVDVYRDVAKEWKTKGLRGAFVWEANMDKAEGWSFATKLSAV